MKKLIITIVLLVSFSVAQKNEGQKEPVKEGDRQIEQLMNNMPDNVKHQVQETIMKAEQAKKDIQQAKQDGLNDQEIEALMEQKRIQSREAARKAVEKLEGISDETKAKIFKIMEQVQDRTQERKAEMKELNK